MAKRRLATWLLERFFVRFHVVLIISFSFFCGLLASRAALALGADSPLWRYPLVVLASYLAFLLALRLWLWHAGFRFERAARDVDSGDLVDLDLPGFSGGSPTPSGATVPELPGGMVPEFPGGGFGGGGASGSWDAAPDLGAVQTYEAPPLGVAGVEVGDVADLGGADEGCGVLILLLVALAALLAVFGVALHVLLNGPAILAEAALEAAMAAGFFGRLNRIRDPGWVGGAIAASWQYFAIVLAIAMLLAWTVHSLAPGARTLVEAFHRLM